MQNMTTDYRKDKNKIGTTVFVCFFTALSPSPLCVMIPLQPPIDEQTRRNGNFWFKSSLTTATSYCFVMLFALNFSKLLVQGAELGRQD